MDLQINALKHAGCRKIFTDYGVSGKGFDRPGLGEALGSLENGGMLVVWRLDRLGRSLPKLIQLVDDLGKQNAGFRSLTENIDTSSSGGRLVFHIMGALAEFERTLISERTRAGMEAARKRGRHLGRKPSMTSDQIEQAKRALDAGELQWAVAKRFHVTPRTLRRYVTNRF